MRLYATLLLTSVCLCCKPKRDDSTSVTEMLKSPQVEERKPDSSAEIKKSKIALPGISFGISLKEYQATNKYMLQGFGSNTYFVKPFFNSQSQLIKIELAGLSRNASNSDTKLWDDHRNLVNFMSNDNGAPKILAAAPKLSEVKPGEIKWTHSWASFSKRIKVGMAKGTTGETYEVVGWIYDKSMLDNKAMADSLMIHPSKKEERKLKKRSKRSRKVKKSDQSAERIIAPTYQTAALRS